MAAAGTSEKGALRKRMRAVLRGISEEAIAAESAKACGRVAALMEDCKSISIYLAMPQGECQTTALLEHAFRNEKSVFVPRVDGATEC